MKIISTSTNNIVLEATPTEVRQLIGYEDDPAVYQRRFTPRTGDVIRIPNRYKMLQTLRWMLNPITRALESGFQLLNEDGESFSTYLAIEADEIATSEKLQRIDAAKAKRIARAVKERDRAQLRLDKIVGNRVMHAEALAPQTSQK